MEEVKGNFDGKPYHRIVYFALDKRGRKKGNPIKSSLIGKKADAEALKKRCKYNSENIRKLKLKGRIKEIVSATLKTAKTRKQFVKELQKKGIDVVFRENKDGRIYGVTFIDHLQRTALNGFRLGKEFSANVLNGQFGQNISQHDFEEKPGSSGDKEELTPGMFSFLTLETQGENYEEESFIRKMKRRLKRKRKL